MDYEFYQKNLFRYTFFFVAVFVAAVAKCGTRRKDDLLPPAVASANSSPAVHSATKKYQLVIFTFGYGGLVDTYVTALYSHNKIYLPVHSLFDDLKIDNRADLRAKTVSGFYIEESDKYELDFKTMTAKIGNRYFKLDSSAVIEGPVDAYLLPRLFRELFGLDLKTDMSKLTLFLSTKEKLPIVEDYQRQVNLQYQTQPLAIFRPQAPLLYPRRRALLDGGVFDYSLASFYSDGLPSYSYDFAAGAELLGGDIEGSLTGDLAGGQSTIYSKQLHWRYVFDSTRVITSASIGNLYSNGLNQYDFRGIQITNEPVQIRKLFGGYAFNETVHPGWETELYLNGERVGYARADALGNVHFDIPLIYGTSYLQLKSYGPSGQHREYNRRIQIPFTLIPEGELDYTINAGRLANSNSDLVQADVAYGFSGWMTDRIGFDYLQSPLINKPVPYNWLTIRIGAPYVFSVKAAPSMLYEASVSAIYPSQASLDVTFEHYEVNPLYNPSDRNEQLFLTGYLPFYFGDDIVNLNVAGNGQTFRGGGKTLTYSAGLSGNVSRLNISAEYTGSYQDYLNTSPVIGKDLSMSLLYSFFVGSGPFSFLNGTLGGVTSYYDLVSRSVTNVRFDVSQYFGNAVSVQLSATRDFIDNLTFANLQVTFDLPFIQASSSTEFQGSQRSYSQYVSGSIGYDSHYGKFLFNGIHWVGQSAVSMRMYLDDNQDGKFYKGDQVIKNGDITLRQAVSSDLFKSGVIRAWDLLPYSRYSADVQSGSLRNPLWVPERKSFSFITDPNVYKAIDIPFYTAGVLEGSVRRLQKGVMRAVPGIQVMVESTNGCYRKDISAFNDGSIYYIGVPPGKYTIRVDSIQLADLGVRPVPAYRKFTVEFKKTGDFIRGLDFVLKKAKLPEAETESGKAILSMRYLVQLGAFSTDWRARDFAAEAQQKTKRRVFVRYDSRSGLYVVQLDTMKLCENAYYLEQDLIYNHGMRDALVLVLPDSNVIYTYSVRLGFLRTLGEAKRLASEARDFLRLKPRITYSSPLGLYEVIVGKYKTRREARALADKAGWFGQFKYASIRVSGRYKIPRYAVLMKEFPGYGAAESFARYLFDDRGIDALIDFDSSSLKFRVYTTPLPHKGMTESLLKELKSLKLFRAPHIIRVD